MRTSLVLLLTLFMISVEPLRADPPKVVDLEVQEVNGTSYFRVRLQDPGDRVTATPPPLNDFLGTRRNSSLDPQRWSLLISQDGRTRNIYFNADIRFGEAADRVAANLKENGLEFIGKIGGEPQEAKFQLIYQKRFEPELAKDPKGIDYLQLLLEQKASWTEETIKLDFSKAKKLPVLKGQREPTSKDLQGQWAQAQGNFFAGLEQMTPEFSFYGFARLANNRQYKVNAQDIGPARRINDDPADEIFRNRRLYELTTGAAAITESLALNRLRNPNAQGKDEDRTIPIAGVQGIDIAEHPWAKMMGSNKPVPEPLSHLVPHDNYYVTFKNVTKFLDASDLIDRWGTMLIRAYEVKSEDSRLKPRLERQLCLKGDLARLLGPTVIQEVALTGNDPYLREGSDLTILFHLKHPTLFKTGVDQYINEARTAYGKRLAEEKIDYHGITIESYVSPQRVVSLHRAFYKDVAIYSNSPIGIRRVLDSAQGRLKPLADSLDFQYMRTVFQANDNREDGFAFLSDPFIRNLVGPATRIKERRRLEALTSLRMVTDGALFAAWETGRLPESHEECLQRSGLKAEELFTPDGNGAFWDGKDHFAFSTNYNTLHFSTPLVELPISLISKSEAAEYEQFRREYLNLWRRFFDPIGMRFTLRDDEIRWETYILPLVNNSQYNMLRQFTGEKTMKFDLNTVSDRTLMQFKMRLAPNLFGNMSGGSFLGSRAIETLLFQSWLGEWFSIHFDESPIYGKLLEKSIRKDVEGGSMNELDLLQLPVTIGFEVRNTMAFAGLLATLRKEVMKSLPGGTEWEPMKPYKDIEIVRIKADRRNTNSSFDPTLYYVLVDRAFYLSLQEAPLKEIIDRHVARKDRKPGETVETSSVFYVAPKALQESRDLVRLYLAWESHRRVERNERLLYPLYHSGIVTAQDGSAKVEDIAMQFLGFVPTSPDRKPFSYAAKTDEVSHEVHGSIRRPRFEIKGPTTQAEQVLLEELRFIRAELNFREDGIHTILTLRKQEKK